MADETYILKQDNKYTFKADEVPDTDVLYLGRTNGVSLLDERIDSETLYYKFAFRKEDNQDSVIILAICSYSLFSDGYVVVPRDFHEVNMEWFEPINDDKYPQHRSIRLSLLRKLQEAGL